MASLRNLYDQFTNLTTLDGNRLERVLRDLVARYNKLQPKDIQKRWVETRYFLTLHPCDTVNATSAQQDRLPWMGIQNYNAATELKGGLPDDGIQNEWRLKGTNVPGIVIDSALSDQNQYSWTTSLYFDKPVILDSLSTLIDSVGPWPGLPEDLFVIVELDDVYLRENRELSQVLVFKYKQTPTETSAIRFFVDNPTADMTPTIDAANVPPKLLRGFYQDIKHMNIPVPEKSRVRISYVVSRYDPATFKTQTPGWMNLWNCSINVLEALEVG